MEPDAKSSPINPDIKLVTIDVKMQIRTLHAKVTFLQETGGMSEEIERMMTELAALCNTDDSLSTTQQPAPAATTVLPKLLLKAETLQAHSEYVGPNWKHLLIKPGDTIIAYAYTNKETAVGFNTRTHLGGLFPIDTAQKIDPQPHEKVETFIATSPAVLYDTSDTIPSALRYTSGQYVRVCRWEKQGGWAYGFNLSTLAMGKFDSSYQFKRVEWHEKI
ncbi:hypothetical protein BKA64DRAFT_408840 [Cadophora sp. MPI-SDFR-AT-0126]|nr:hypothetical protein BKA64DRAFT_408840 [Leotiomycetes sp. MPI-SDFR-AT-0126]